MTNIAVKYQRTPSNVVSFEDLRNRRNGIDVVEPEVKQSSKAGKSCEVYAFKSEEEIKAMIDVFDRHIAEAPDDDKRRIAWRNKALFVIGINTSTRGSDLRLMTWGFFFNEDGSFKESYKIMPKKTKRYKKYVTLYFNDAIKKVVNDFISEYPYENLNDYVFASRVGGEPIIASSIWRIVKNAAREAGLPQNIGSHSLRKTFSYHMWRQSKDKQKALVLLQYILNHSSSDTTLRYIGVAGDEAEEAFGQLNLGIDFL